MQFTNVTRGCNLPSRYQIRPFPCTDKFQLKSTEDYLCLGLKLSPFKITIPIQECQTEAFIPIPFIIQNRAWTRFTRPLSMRRECQGCSLVEQFRVATWQSRSGLLLGRLVQGCYLAEQMRGFTWLNRSGFLFVRVDQISHLVKKFSVAICQSRSALLLLGRIDQGWYLTEQIRVANQQSTF